jgi:hypothetical protein
MEKTEIRMMRKLSELYQNKDEIRVLDDRFIIPGSTFPEIRSDSKKRVNIIKQLTCLSKKDKILLDLR